MNCLAAALDDAKECVRHYPAWEKGWARLGSVLFRLQRLEEALQAYEKGMVGVMVDRVGSKDVDVVIDIETDTDMAMNVLSVSSLSGSTSFSRSCYRYPYWT